MTRKQTFHFISGLPRAGSTLLSAILRQNPRFHASVASPTPQLCQAILGHVSVGSEWAPLVGQEQRRDLLRGIFNSYYAKLPQEVIFDTNRSWPAKLHLLRDLFPQAKVIACVRNVAWVMDSLERVYRANPYENSRLFHDEGERGTVYSRTDTLAQRGRVVGLAWMSLKDAFYGEHSNSLLLVDYEFLTRYPDQVIPKIYEFIGEPCFEHNYEKVEFDTPVYDAVLGLSGLHRVRPKVGFTPRATILPPDVFEKYSRWSFWQNPTGSSAQILAQGTSSLPIPSDNSRLMARAVST